MTDRIYQVTEVIGTSTDDIEQAIRNGIGRAAKTVRNLDWFQVTEIRGQIADGQAEHFQVTMKIGFRLDDTE